MPSRARFRRLDGGAASVMQRAVAYWKANAYSGSGEWLDLSGRGHHLQLGSISGADTNDPLFLDYTGIKYAYLPGISGNYLSAPDSAALSITGDIDIRCAAALTDWTPTAVMTFVAKFGGAGQRGYQFFVNTNGTLGLDWSADGTTEIIKNSTVAPTVSDGALLLVRATLDVDNGALGNDVKFYTKTSTEAAAAADLALNTGWTQLGSTVTTAVATSIFDGDAALTVGATDAGAANLLAGKVYSAIVKGGIDGTSQFVADLTATPVEPYATFVETSANAATVTINRAATGRKTCFVDRDLFLFGTDDYMQRADHRDFDFDASESFTIMAVVREYHWRTDATGPMYVCKATSFGAGEKGYALQGADTGSGLRVIVADGATQATDSAPNPTNGVVTTISARRMPSSDLLEAFTDSAGNGAAADTLGGLANTSALVVGARGDKTAQFAHFELIAAGVWREALSPADLETARRFLVA